MKLALPNAKGRLEDFRLKTDPIVARAPKAQWNRVAFAAAHVVADPLSSTGAIDWKATLAYRRHLLKLGFGIAEAMDTSQRGMGLSWPDALELIRHSLADAGDKAQQIYSGCGTDQLNPTDARSIEDVIRAYEEQMEAIQKLGGRCLLYTSTLPTKRIV